MYLLHASTLFSRILAAVLFANVIANISVADTLSNSSKPILFDPFEYTIERNGGDASVFKKHGWSGAKAENITGRGGFIG